MDLTVPDAARAELAAAFLQMAITVALALLCLYLYRSYRKRYFGWLALAWSLYALRLAAIVSFLLSGNRVWLFWHQVITGWAALALLWAAFVFSQQLRWRRGYFWLVAFPPVWSFVAIYRLDVFLLAAGPAVLFLSAATAWTGLVFLRYHRAVGSPGAVLLGVALLCWAAHHLDYPFLRARGVWVPWGYYLDVLFVLAIGAGILLLVLDDLRRGLEALAALSGDLRRVAGEDDVLQRLLQRPLTLPGVRGTAMYGSEHGAYVAGAGLCTDWVGSPPAGGAGRAIEGALRTGRPSIERSVDGRRADPLRGAYAYAAALPVFRGASATSAMLIVGEARDPFAALDTAFLVALGQQVGAALESAHLYDRLEVRTRELERLAGRMIKQHEDERRRISRELHDETAQVFSATKLQLGRLREVADPAVASRLDGALELMDEGIRSIRRVTEDLRPSLLDDLGLVPALRALVHQVGEQGHLEARFEASPSLPTLSDDAEVGLFRALQEGLANVVRHAEAHAVRVALAAEERDVVLRIRDDGHGLPPDVRDPFATERSMGLAGMRERIAALGGSVTLHPVSGRGVELVVRVPAASPEGP